MGMTLAMRSPKESPELKTLYDTDSAVKTTIDLAREIEDNARHVSVHAAGTVVSPTPMTDFTPLQLEPSGTKVITQYEFHSCEEIGLVKFDILGIRNLSILGAARDIVESTRNVKVNLGKIPLDDKKTFAMLARGETMGTFQLGGSGMTKWLKELKPNRIEDIMIMIALFRPGPMANIPEFIARKNKAKQVTYMHPKMSKFLDKSYGILVYQEDIMFTALEMAGYTWETVDALRKAIGKKLPKEMAQQHEVFIKGCVEHSQMTTAEAELIWELFVPFQGYGFNKAHAASYGIISYQTSYMKANYPVEYMTALLTAESGNTEKIVEAIDECRRMGVVVLPPDINASGSDFTIEPQPQSLDGRAIRFGLSAIKNVGNVAIDIILASRAQGPFTSLTDFCLRVDSQKVNRKVLESLIKSGCMDNFGKRSAMLEALDKIRDMGMSLNKLKSLGQFSLFSDDEKTDTTDHFSDIPEFEKHQKLTLEKELLGFYLTEHPHSDKIAEINSSPLVTHRISQLHTDDVSGVVVTVGGVVESCRNVMTKTNNQPMCFVKLTDLIKSVEIVVFPKVFAATSAIWQPDNVVIVRGKIESRGQPEVESDETEEVQKDIVIIADSAAQFTGSNTQLPKLITGNGNGQRYTSQNPHSSAAKPPSPPPAATPSRKTIKVPKGFPQNKLVSLNSLLQNYKGSTPADLVFDNNGNSKVLPLPFGLNWNTQLEEEIAKLLN
jgi:DNA polymerase-3 subunit alpha